MALSYAKRCATAAVQFGAHENRFRISTQYMYSEITETLVKIKKRLQFQSKPCYACIKQALAKSSQSLTTDNRKNIENDETTLQLPVLIVYPKKMKRIQISINFPQFPTPRLQKSAKFKPPLIQRLPQAFEVDFLENKHCHKNTFSHTISLSFSYTKPPYNVNDQLTLANGDRAVNRNAPANSLTLVSHPRTYKRVRHPRWLA